jgi:hypothetical protein
MSYQIKFRDKWSGKTRVHTYEGNVAGAEGWARSLAEEHGSKAEAVHIADGPYDHSGKVTHVISVGDDNGRRR